jgi:DNA invertase Pin-like site-specific DNA recombinase
MLRSNSSSEPVVAVEYDVPQGRRKKLFSDAYEARRFYAAKLKAGKNPVVRKPSEASKRVGVYVRVSTTGQDVASQQPDLQKWVDAQDRPVEWYTDQATGKNMDRPGWKRLEGDIRGGMVDTVVVWRMDRLGRSATGLSALFDWFVAKKINLISLKDGLDLSTAAGRLMANVLASVAQYETEVRGERVKAGQAVARSEGKRWGGSKPGVRKRVTPSQIRAIHRMKADGESIAEIARAFGFSRPTIYDVLRGPLTSDDQEADRKLRGSIEGPKERQKAE